MIRKRNPLVQTIKQHLVPILFGILCILSIQVSGQALSYVATETINRVTRNTVLVFSLIFPVLCGMGLNFGIVLGAIAAQVGLTLITHLSIDGIPGILLAFLVATVLAVAIGYFVGLLFNKVKGQEMITGMILGFAAIGVYDIICIFMLGSIIPMYNPEIMLQTEGANGELTYVGLRNTIELHSSTKSVIDNLWKVPFKEFLPWFLLFCLTTALIVITYQHLYKKKTWKKSCLAARGLLIIFALCAILQVLMLLFPSVAQVFFIVQVPVATGLLIALIALFVIYIFRTKLGQDIRTVGNSMQVATASGINVDRTRIIATVLSMVVAAWGQIIYLQNIGNIQTYNSHEQVGTYAVAALLVGGASLEKATIGQAVTGTTLFHILFFITPLAGTVLFGDSMYGEYFRVFLCYGIIAISLALYALKKNREEQQKLQEEARRIFERA